MKIIEVISRVIVGGIFFVSGLVKANDIMGFSYKLEEYFSPDVFNIPFLEDYAVALATLVCVAEIVLGLAVVLGAKMKLATWSLLGLTVFFAFLTWYSAYYDAVKECGCFGDALSLTPWQSFYKDIFLMFFVLILVGLQNKIQLNTTKEDMIIGGLSLGLVALMSLGIFSWGFPILLFAIIVIGAVLIKNALKSANKEWVMAAFVTMVALGFGYYTYHYLPVKDYRAYAVGKSIREQMKSAEELGLTPTKYYTLYTMVNESGETKKVKSTDYLKDKLWKDKSWKIDSDLSEGPFVDVQGYEPAISDFKIDSFDGEDKTHAYLDSPDPLLIVVFKSLEDAQGDPDLKTMFDVIKSVSGKVEVIGMSPSSYEEADAFRHEHDLQFPFYVGDQIVLKTMVRANPGMLLLKDGVVLGKWHNNNLPSETELLELANR